MSQTKNKEDRIVADEYNKCISCGRKTIGDYCSICLRTIVNDGSD